MKLPLLCSVATLLLSCRTFAASASSSDCVALFGQCGGTDYSGPACCTGTECVAFPDNPFFSQCQLAESIQVQGVAVVPPVELPSEPAVLTTADDCAAVYSQCGGEGYTGPTCCQAGASCVTEGDNLYYSQCEPAGATTQPSSTEAVLPDVPAAATEVGVTDEGAPLTVTTPPPTCYTTFDGFAAVCDACLVAVNGEASQATSSLDDCQRVCTGLGWGTCRSVTFAAGQCYLYNAQIEAMGAHGFREASGSVVASQCAPPPELAKFPDNPRADIGVDWSRLCQVGTEYEVIPNQLPSCGTACQIPSGTGLQVQSVSDCAAACLAKPECKCAYFEKNGWCDLHSVSCEDPDNGARFNSRGTSDAIQPCRKQAHAVSPGALDDYEAAVDWHGLWDDYCESDVPTFVIPDQETFCGPPCHLMGTETQRLDSVDACSELCIAHPECMSAFYATDGRCSLKKSNWRDTVSFDTRFTSLGVQEAVATCRQAVVA